jgi:hypothetical protein
MDLTSLPPQIAIAGALVLIALLIVREAREWIQIRKHNKTTGPNGACPLRRDRCVAEDIDLRVLCRQVEDLHAWLGTRDETGAFSWAVGPILRKLVDILDRMERSMEQMNQQLREQ